MKAVKRTKEPSAKYLVEAEPILARKFESLVAAHGDVAKFRNLILSLAICGKLVPQVAADASAKSLLATILAADGKGMDTIPPVMVKPFDLPRSWEWTFLGSVVEIVRGITFPANEKTKEAAFNRIACLRTTNVQKSVEWDDLLFIDRSFVGREDQLIRHHDIVMSMANSRELVGKVALIEDVPHPEATFGGFLGVLRPGHIVPRYLMVVLRSSYARLALIGSASQTTNIANISLGKLRPLPFPVPPLAEQHRIVARVEELMKLCDALEQNGRLADEQHARLTSTLFDALAASESAQALTENWQRVAEHFNILLDRPEALDAFEQTITQLAVRGLLVPKNLEAGDGRALLLRLQASGTSSGKRVKTELVPIGDDDTPFPVPEHWAWSRLGDVVDITGGVTLGRKGALANPLTLPYLRVANVQRGHLNLVAEVKTVSIDAAELSRFQLKAGDLLTTEGGDWDKVGRTCIWRNQIPTCLHQNHIFRARGRTVEWSPEWGQLYLNSTDARAYFASSAKQTTNLASINMTQLRHCAFPLPPLSEQLRIVARVVELQKMCSELRSHLTQVRETQSSLADALVAEVTQA